MAISELALGFLTNLIYDSSKKIPEEIFDTYSKVYDKAIEDFSKKNYKLNGIQINTYFHQKNVELAIRKYLKNPDKLDCSNVLIQEFFELFSEEDFSHEDADLILITFFETLDSEIEKYPELIVYLDHYLAKRTDEKVQETNQGVQELSRDVKEISLTVNEIKKVVNVGRVDQNRKKLGTNFDESLKKYLNKIIEEDGKNGLSDVYTELSAKEILPVTLKFRDEGNNIMQEFEVLELVEREEKLIISGESGSGKTTTLRWLNFTFAANYLETKEGEIPLYVELDSYIRGSFYDYFKHQIKKKGLPETSLKALLERNAIILLDGFDLLSSTENFSPTDEISIFISEYSSCKFVVSSRQGFFEIIRNDFKVSELEKLTDEKIRIFVEKSVENRRLAEVLINKILNDPKLKSILTNPMLLYLAVKVTVERQKSNYMALSATEDLFPQTRSELYEIFVSDLFKHSEKNRRLHADRAQIENALTDLFFEIQCRNKVSCKYNEALKIVKKHAGDLTFQKISSQEILEDSIKLGLLKKNGSEIGYGIHQSFQEYFTAIKLKELFEAGFDISESFSQPKWEDVIIFASEMLDCVDEFIDSMLSNSELFLASKCVNKASDKTKEKLCDLLASKLDSEYKLDKINSVESLGKIGIVGIGLIADALKAESEDVRWNAARVLGNLKSDTSVQLLINALNDDVGYVRWNAAEALGNLKSDTAIQFLIESLKDKNEEMRWYAVNALGNIKSDAVLQLLINALKDENRYVRLCAVETLGNIKSNTASRFLINALKDENKYMREGAAKALGNLKSDTAVHPLIDALTDEDGEVRGSAAEALGNLKSDIAVQPLVNSLKDEEGYVRGRVARALGNIKSNTALQFLVNALKDENKYVREGAIRAFGNLKSDIAVPLLINALTDEDGEVRGSAAEALGNLKSDIAVQPLINALNDDVGYVRWNAAKALGNLKSDTSVQPLINALKDNNRYVRGSAAEALGNLKSDTSVQPLINSLKDEDEHVRERVVRALGNIKFNTALQSLINALKDENRYMQLNIVSVLRNICNVKNKKHLEELLESSDIFVRNSAYEILSEIEKEDNSKLILFKDLKKRSKITSKYGIFVSSVQKELENERATIQDLVKNDQFLSECYTSLLYEYEPAYPEKTLEGCLNSLNSCQVYMLVVGVKYGTLVGEISITHREYHYAKEKNLPILVFIKGERDMGREEGTEALLREIESDEYKYKRFRNVIELRDEVKESLQKLLRDEDKFLKS